VSRRKIAGLAVPAALVAAAAVWWWLKTAANRIPIEELDDGVV
jgi:hypothetical protein